MFDLKTNIKGYKEYSREQIKVMKGMVKSIKELQSKKEFEVEDSQLKYELLKDKYTIDLREDSEEKTNELEVSIDQYEQILEEKEVKADIKAKAYKQENKEFWRLEEDGPEITRIKEILNSELIVEHEKRRSLSCPEQFFHGRPIYFDDDKTIEIPKAFAVNVETQCEAKILHQREVQTNIRSMSQPESQSEGTDKSQIEISNTEEEKNEEDTHHEGTSEGSISFVGTSDMDSEIEDKEDEINSEIEEELKYKIPKKMMDATKYMTDKLKNLNVDEFGDQIYDGEDADDEKNQSLKKACSVMKFWISKALGERIIQRTRQIREEKKTFITNKGEERYNADNTHEDSEGKRM